MTTTNRNTMTTMTIGQVAKRVQIHIETIRFYERQGLIDKTQRTPAGYRQYTTATIERLQFITRAKALGFTLQEISDLLNLREPSTKCADVQARAEAKIADIEARITQLNAIKCTLEELVLQCRGENSLNHCPIFNTLKENQR